MRAMVKSETKPIWNTSTFLVYTGGLTVLAGAFLALAYLSTQYPGNGQGTGWTLLILVILYAIANALRRADRPIAAGIFAFSSVIAWILFVVLLFKWWGWNPTASLSQWSWSRNALLLLILVAAAFNRRRFRFPFIRVVSAVTFFLLVLSVLPDGGNLRYVWALLVGLLYLMVGNITDKPSAFWLHFVGGALVGMSILHWCHTTDFDFAVVSFMALVFVVWAHWTRRSIWAVYGTIGFFIATFHYLGGSPTGVAGGLVGMHLPQLSPIALLALIAFAIRALSWSYALGIGLLGFWLVALGMLGKRKRSHKPAAVVVETTTVVVEPAAE